MNKEGKIQEVMGYTNSAISFFVASVNLEAKGNHGAAQVAIREGERMKCRIEAKLRELIQ